MSKHPWHTPPQASTVSLAESFSESYPLQASLSRYQDTPGRPTLHENYGSQVGDDCRATTRTPSPTPSEAEALAHSMNSMKRKWSMNAAYFKDPVNIFSLVITVIIVGGVITLVAFQDKIFQGLSPATKWLRETPGAWLIPVVIMIILSFPPLFGQELVALYCSHVWGIGRGFGVVAAGTILGELATYCTFRYCCLRFTEKSLRSNLQYALLSEVIREGGIKIFVMVRYSSYPSHIATAIFASAGMGIWTFLIAAVLALPMQFANVYLGVSDTSGDPGDENGDHPQSKITATIKTVLIVVTVLITIGVAYYIGVRMDAIKGRVIYARRKARMAKVDGATSAPSY